MAFYIFFLFKISCVYFKNEWQIIYISLFSSNTYNLHILLFFTVNKHSKIWAVIDKIRYSFTLKFFTYSWNCEKSLKYLRLWLIYLSTHRNFCWTGGKAASVRTGEFKWKFSFFYLFEVLVSPGLLGGNPAGSGWIQRPHSAEATVSAGITTKR